MLNVNNSALIGSIDNKPFKFDMLCLFPLASYTLMSKAIDAGVASSPEEEEDPQSLVSLSESSLANVLFIIEPG